MHRKLFSCAALIAAALTAGLAAALPARAALADTAVRLPISDYYQMAVDSVHGHLFFSQGLLEDSIVVTDFSGARAGAITEPAGVAGITLSPDGATLYAALPVANEVAAISTRTLRQTAVYKLSDDDEPLDVAVQSGKLWASYYDEHLGFGAIGSFSLSVAHPAMETNPATGGWYDAPLIAADPTDTGNELVAADWGETPASLASYDTASDPATARAQGIIPPHDDFDGCDNAQDIAVTPGGSQFIPVCGNPYTHYAYSTADLTQQGSYQSGEYPSAIAIASGTGLVAAGITSPTPGLNDIYVYAPGGTAPLHVFDAGNGALISRGLGVTASGAALFAVSLAANSDGTVAFILNRYDMAPLPALPTPARHHAPSLTISATPGTAAYRPVVHVTVQLGASAGNRTVTIDAAPFGGGTATRLASGTVNAQGVLTASYPAAHSTTFTAAFAGDAGYQAKAVTATALVSASVTMKLNGYYASKRIGATSFRLYHQIAQLDAAITVAPDKHGECVRLEEQEHYGGAWHAKPAVGCVTLGGHSTAVYRLALRHEDRGNFYRVRADYVRSKDSSNLNTDSAWQYYIVQR